MSCHRCLAPENTACITVQAKDVREGDYLDTTGEGRLPRVERGIHRIFLDAEVVCGEVTLHRERMLTMGVRHDRRVKVWRDAAKVGLPSFVPPCACRPVLCVPACATPDCRGALSACPIDNLVRENAALVATVDDWKRADSRTRLCLAHRDRKITELDREVRQLRQQLADVRKAIT